MQNTLYNEAFFEEARPGAEISAGKILSIVLPLIDARSVVDVGCGLGTWLSVVRKAGVEDILGIDGHYVRKESLRIPRECFVEEDLSVSLKVDRQFDLALCLEVIEHLPSSRNDSFLDQLTSLSPAILFSGSTLFQEGTSHVNEQWLEFWVEQFGRRGYRAVDCVRPQVWRDPAVDWWYAQNTLLYVRESELGQYPKLADYIRKEDDVPFSWIHPRFLLYKQSRSLRHVPIRQLVNEVRHRLWRKISLQPGEILPEYAPTVRRPSTSDLRTSSLK